MPASSFCASRLRDATRRMSATELVCAVPSQQRLRRSSVGVALQTSTQLVVLVLPAAPRGGTRQHFEGGRALRAASAPSQQDQLHRSSRSRRRQCPVTMSGRRGEKHHRAAPRRIIGQPLDGSSGSPSTDHRAASRRIIGQPLERFATFWAVTSPNLLRS